MNKLIQIAIILIAGCTNAQIKLSGLIKNSEGNPLEMVNLIAINAQTKKLDSYGFSDAFGNYKLNLNKNTSYTIRVSYVGMKTKEISINTLITNVTKNIVLEIDDSLNEVEIIAKIPVTIKGDTIVYNADSFKSGTEKKLADILKKLPGIEVNNNGEIKAQGKKVKKVMVDGKDFFDGDTKLATKNIPANAIDKVQVLKNYSEVSQMSSVTDNEDNVVINIKLKEGKKNFWFGSIAIGATVETDNFRHLFYPKLFYYSPKGSINIIGNLNNIGKIPFTRRDYFKFSGGLKSMDNRGTSFNLISSDIGFLTLRNDKAKEVESRFGAINFSYSVNKKWGISGFGIYSGNKTDLEDNTTKNYINTFKNILPYNPEKPLSRRIINTETTQSLTQQKTDLALLKLSSIYEPNINNQFNYDVFAKISTQNQTQFFSSNRTYLNTVAEQIPVNEFIKQSPYSINQSINYYYTPNNKNIFTFEAQHLWQYENLFYNAKLSQLSFANKLGLTTAQSIYNVSQNKCIKSNQLGIELDYYYVINSKSNLNVTFGFALSRQQFNSTIFEILGNGVQQNIANPNTTNNVDFLFKDYFAGFHYKFITGIFTFNQGVTLHKYSAKNTQLGTYVDNNFTKLLPSASIKIGLKKSEILRLRYNQQIQFTDVNKVAKGYVFNNYNRLYSGNRNLESVLSHNINLSYSSFSMFNYIDVFAFINYSKRINAVKELVEFNGINQTVTSINSIFPDETVSGNASWSKSFKKCKFLISGNVSYSTLNNLFFSPLTNTNENLNSNSFNQVYNTEFSSNFKNSPNFNIGYKIDINRYNQNGNVNIYTTHKPFFNFEAFFSDNLVFSTKYIYNNYRNNNKTIYNYSFLNADVTYKKEKSKWEYVIEATNLLNTKSLNRDSVGSVFNGMSSYSIQPRFITFSVKYNF